MIDRARYEITSPVDDCILDIVERMNQVLAPPTFRRPSQNQTATSGVEGAHEGMTADKSELLPAQLPKEK